MAPNNALPIWGNEKTMNLNSMILTNIQSSPYFKVNLFGLKTYHEVIDEIFYKVNHLEPWEKGSRKTAGQTGMCGGVRGVGAGGIVSTSFCILYKLYTLRLTRKQVNGLMTHSDSPYIRALGFMYIRYTQPPADLWEWYEPYLDDDEECDVKAGGGHVMSMGEMLQQWLTKLEWYATLFPRIPVPVQKTIDVNLKAWLNEHQPTQHAAPSREDTQSKEGCIPDEPVGFGEAERMAQRERSPIRGRAAPSEPRQMSRRSTPPFDIAKAIEQEKGRQRRRSKSPERRSRSRDRRSRSRDRRSRSKDRHRRSRSRERHKKHSPVRERRRSRSRDRSRRDKSKERRRSRERRSHSRERHRDRRHRSRSHEHRRSKEKRRSRSKERKRSPERSSKSHSSKSAKNRENSFERDLKSLKKELSKQREENGK